MADDLLFGTTKPFEKDRKKKQKKQARARVRCPYCWEALKLTENDDADQVVIAHGRKCWWLEKNGKGHAEIAERGLKKNESFPGSEAFPGDTTALVATRESKGKVRTKRSD